VKVREGLLAKLHERRLRDFQVNEALALLERLAEERKSYIKDRVDDRPVVVPVDQVGAGAPD